jgi:hypothetical protein
MLNAFILRFWLVFVRGVVRKMYGTVMFPPLKYEDFFFIIGLLHDCEELTCFRSYVGIWVQAEVYVT